MATVNVIPRKDEPIRGSLRIRFDVWIALDVLGLLIAGMLVVYSSSFDLAFRSGLTGHNPTYYFGRQFVFLWVGLGGMVVAMSFDYRHFRKLSLPAMAITLTALLGLALFGVKNEELGAARGLFNNSIQPSELAKLATILYIAHWLSTKGDRIKSVSYGLIPFSLMVGSVCALIASQPDLSTAALLAAISFSLFFLAGAHWGQITTAVILITVVFIAAINGIGYASSRVDIWKTAWRDPLDLDTSNQVRLITIGLGNGGLFGQGPGQGEIKYFVQAAHTDATFAVWAEEFGFVGSLFVIGSFALLVWRGVLAAKRAREPYGFLLAMGITVWISYQALLNIGVVSSTLPVTGMPLPFMAYGGTSLVVSLTGIGILLNISRDAAITRTLERQQFYMRERHDSDEPPPRKSRLRLPGRGRRARRKSKNE